MSDIGLMSFSGEALERIIEIRDQEPGDDEYGLLIEITGLQGTQFGYSLSFVPLGETGTSDHVERHGDLTVIIPSADTANMTGATLAMSSDPMTPGLAIDNPNNPSPQIPDVPDGDLTGPLAEQVAQVLDRQVNPAIAAHGGNARLVSEENGVCVPAAWRWLPGLWHGGHDPTAGNRADPARGYPRDRRDSGRHRPPGRREPLLRSFQEGLNSTPGGGDSIRTIGGRLVIRGTIRVMGHRARARASRLLLVVALVVAACGSPDQEVSGVEPGATTAATSYPTSSVRDESEPYEEDVATRTVEPQPTEDRSAEDPAAGPTEPVPVSWRQPAPEFPAGLDWLNTDLPLTIESLRGKIVMLDFWTYGCINCIHVIPDLERLEEEYADELVVIGVHSAKFDQESATENIRRVVLRYGVQHPVVNDAGFEIWRSYRVRAWPSTYVIDPAGGVVGYHSGEGVYDVVKPVLDSLVEEFADSIDRTPMALRLERQGLPETVFSFPGKVTVDPAGMLYVSDSNHHRIVVTDLEGRVEAVYGSGLEGFTDGPSSDATFRDPQGTALSVDGSLLYVADTGNHALRAVDLSSGEVTTVAGTGKRAWPPRTGSALTTPLASPWDVELDPDTGLLYLAMAGTHQIWFFDPDEGTVGPYAGSGGEGTVNGPGNDATLAQPSGLALAGDGRLFFADSESSAIRWVDTESDERTVGIIAGSDADLFTFGDPRRGRNGGPIAAPAGGGGGR